MLNLWLAENLKAPKHELSFWCKIGRDKIKPRFFFSFKNSFPFLQWFTSLWPIWQFWTDPGKYNLSCLVINSGLTRLKYLSWKRPALNEMTTLVKVLLFNTPPWFKGCSGLGRTWHLSVAFFSLTNPAPSASHILRPIQCNLYSPPR